MGFLIVKCCKQPADAVRMSFIRTGSFLAGFTAAVTVPPVLSKFPENAERINLAVTSSLQPFGIFLTPTLRTRRFRFKFQLCCLELTALPFRFPAPTWWLTTTCDSSSWESVGTCTHVVPIKPCRQPHTQVRYLESTSPLNPPRSQGPAGPRGASGWSPVGGSPAPDAGVTSWAPED